MPQLDYSSYLGQILWLIGCFSLLYLFVHFIFMPRIESMMHARVGSVRKNLEVAEELSLETREIRGRIEADLRVVQEEARLLTSQAEFEIKKMLEQCFVEGEARALQTLKQESEHLSLWYEEQLREQLPTLVLDMKPQVIAALIKNLSCGAKV